MKSNRVASSRGGLVDGVADLLHVDLGDDVEARHAAEMYAPGPAPVSDAERGPRRGPRSLTVGREGFEPPKPKRLVYSQFPLSTRAPTREGRHDSDPS